MVFPSNNLLIVVLTLIIPIGGAERLVVDAALGLQDFGHEVDIYTSHHDPNHCFEETKDGVLAREFHSELVTQLCGSIRSIEGTQRRSSIPARNQREISHFTCSFTPITSDNVPPKSRSATVRRIFRRPAVDVYTIAPFNRPCTCCVLLPLPRQAFGEWRVY